MDSKFCDIQFSHKKVSTAPIDQFKWIRQLSEILALTLKAMNYFIQIIEDKCLSILNHHKCFS